MLTNPSRKQSLRKQRDSLAVECLEDRRVLSTLVSIEFSALGVAAAYNAAESRPADSRSLESSSEHGRGSPSDQGHEERFTEHLQRWIERLPDHVIDKHPIIQRLIGDHDDPVSIPGQGNSGNNGNGNNGGNSGNGNNGNGNSGSPTRPDTPTPPAIPTTPPINPTTPPRAVDPSGPTPGGGGGGIARPDVPEPDNTEAPPVDATAPLSFAPSAAKADAAAEAQAAAPVSPGQNGADRSQSSSATVVAASTRLVQELAEAGGRPTAEIARAQENETAADAELLQQIVYIDEAGAPAAELTEADLAVLSGGGIDLRALDAALEQALAGIERAGQTVVENVVRPGFTSWIAGAIGTLLAAEGLRRFARRRRARAAATLADDPALTWVPGMPGSFSIEDA